MKLYVREESSDAGARFLAARGEAVIVNDLHELEIRNALRLKRFRDEIGDERLAAVPPEPETNAFPVVNPVPVRTSSPCPRRNTPTPVRERRQPPSVANRSSAMVLAHGYATVTELGYWKALRSGAVC